MGAGTDTLVEDIRQARETAERDLEALKNRLRREADVRVQVERHPWWGAGVVVATVGMLLLFLRWRSRSA